VSDRTVSQAWFDPLAVGLRDRDLAPVLLGVPEGEEAKSLQVSGALLRQLATQEAHRDDVVIALGGGTVGDLAGLVAATYMRGVPFVQVPTTLTAQVDAAIGGKTAVNLPEGKNLVGAYWQPSAVLCDTDYLSTLPRREMLNGYGEIARCHFIGAPDLRALSLPEQIAAGVTLKASVVEVDERDGGLRHLLNYGHTLGHALELATGFALRHGEAVAIGTVFAGRLAGALGRIDQSRVDEHLAVVGHYGLPAALPDGVDTAVLVRQMHRDKKAITGLGFVLDGPAGAELVTDVPADVVTRVLDDMPRSPLDRLVEPATTEAAPA
jgi:5-deoxy-5-amino-3-dehydroquinate synthase